MQAAGINTTSMVTNPTLGQKAINLIIAINGFADLFTALDTFPHHNGDGGVHFPFVDRAHVDVLMEALVESFAESPGPVKPLKESVDFVKSLVEAFAEFQLESLKEFLAFGEFLMEPWPPLMTLIWTWTTELGNLDLDFDLEFLMEPWPPVGTPSHTSIPHSPVIS